MTYILSVHISSSVQAAVCREDEVLCPMTFDQKTHLPHALNAVLKEAYEAYGICLGTARIAVDGIIRKNTCFSPVHVTAEEIYEQTMLQDVAFVRSSEAGIHALAAVEGYDLRHPNGQCPESGNGPFALILADERLSSSYAFRDEKGSLHVMRSEQGTNETDAYLNYRGFLDIYSTVQHKLEGNDDMVHFIASMHDEERVAAIFRYRSHSDACERTIRRFIEYLAACAQNTALIIQPRGGLYIWQQIEPSLNQVLKRPYFMYSYEKHPLKREYLRHVPVRLIDDPFLILKEIGRAHV